MKTKILLIGIVFLLAIIILSGCISNNEEKKQPYTTEETAKNSQTISQTNDRQLQPPALPEDNAAASNEDSSPSLPELPE